MVVGTIIGASIFVQPSLVSADVRSTTLTLLVWVVAGLLTLIGALATAELSSAFPQTGGVYVFLRRAYSPAVAYLWGWAMFWSVHSGIIAAIATIFARYLGHFVALDDLATRAAAAGAVIVLSAVNYFSVRHGSAVQTFFTVVKLIAISLVVVLGIVFVASHGVQVASRLPGATPTIGGFLSAVLIALNAYGGWHAVTYAAGETHDPARTIPRALIAGTLLVMIAYLAANAAYLAVLPLDRVASSTRVGADFADVVLGRGGADLLSALVILSTLGGMTGLILAGPRVYLAMAEDGLLFRWAGAVHPRYRTPYVAIVLQGVWASVLAFTGSYRGLITRVVYTEWIFWALMVASIWFLRRRADYAPAYRLRGSPVLPAIFVLSSAAVVLYQVGRDPLGSLTGLGLVLAGLPVYWFWTRRGGARLSLSEPVS